MRLAGGASVEDTVYSVSCNATLDSHQLRPLHEVVAVYPLYDEDHVSKELSTDQSLQWCGVSLNTSHLNDGFANTSVTHSASKLSGVPPYMRQESMSCEDA